jgi:hypothetical protein
MVKTNFPKNVGKEGMRWEASRRMEFIEFRLYWEGRVNRGDLTDFFRISIPQASNDIRRYQELSPGNIDYDKSGKFYFATRNFNPSFYTPSSNDYLTQLQQLSSGVISDRESQIKTIPPSFLIPELERPIFNQTLRDLSFSIKDKTDIKITYQSMNAPDSSTRWLAPQAFAFDGFRWHIRAYCFSRKDFRDFAIGRIWEITDRRESELGEIVDHGWNNLIRLKIGANPNLSENQRKTIEREYGMDCGSKIVTIRESFLFYFLKRYGLNKKDPENEANSQHVVLLNPEILPKYFTS